MNSILSLIAGLLALGFIQATPVVAAEPQPGKEFKVISPPLASPKDKIEVIEFFSYACPHCSEFHPTISKWAGSLPKDVGFRRVPVSFGRPEWVRLAKIYYAAEAIGELGKLDTAVFIALHEQRIAFKSDDAVFSWVASKGVDAKKFAEAFNGFSMQNRVQRGDQEATAARIGGVPSLAVDGRYLVNNEAASSYDDLLRLTDLMVGKTRQDRKGK